MRLFFLVIFLSVYSISQELNYRLNYFGNISFSALNESGYITRAYRSRYINNNLDIRQIKLGAQLYVEKDNIEFISQAVAREHLNDMHYSFTWLNTKYNFNNNLSIRVGRMQAPLFLNSDSLEVDYIHLWAKEPVEIYSMIAISHYDAIEVLYSDYFGEYYVESLFTLYGKSREKIDLNGFMGEKEDLKLENLIGIQLNIEKEHFTFKSSYYQGKSTLPAQDALSSFYDMLTAIGYKELIDGKYTWKDENSRFISFGLKYDDGEYIFNSEFSTQNTPALIPKMYAYYLALGYRYDKFTPYISYSGHINNKDHYYEDRLIAQNPNAQPFYDMVKDQIVEALYLTNYSQNTASIGCRYDYKKGLAFKVQLDQIRTKNYGIKNTSNEYERVGFTTKEIGIEDKPIYQITFGMSFAF
jgi:hypothetical protein